MTNIWPNSLVLAGAGKMGGALLRGWIANGFSPGAVTILDPALDATTSAFCEAQGISLSPPETAADVVVLAVKPQTFAGEPGAFAHLAGPGTLVISIMAGVTLSNLRRGLPEAAAVVRAMPNLPAAVGKGATGAAGEAHLTAPQRAMAATLLGAVGSVEWLDESLIDAVTAVSGSGPAYVFHLTECLEKAGVDAGLPADVAARLARATVEGAAALMAAEPDRSPADLREAVTSPGGTTAAALAELRAESGLAQLMTAAVAAATRRAGELAR